MTSAFSRSSGCVRCQAIVVAMASASGVKASRRACRRLVPRAGTAATIDGRCRSRHEVRIEHAPDRQDQRDTARHAAATSSPVHHRRTGAGSSRAGIEHRGDAVAAVATSTRARAASARRPARWRDVDRSRPERAPIAQGARTRASSTAHARSTEFGQANDRVANAGGGLPSIAARNSPRGDVGDDHAISDEIAARPDRRSRRCGKHEARAGWRVAAIAQRAGSGTLSQVARRGSTQNIVASAPATARTTSSTRVASPTTVATSPPAARVSDRDKRDDTMLCGVRRIDDVVSKPTARTEHRDPHVLPSLRNRPDLMYHSDNRHGPTFGKLTPR